jgi:hypothetical protein
MGTVYLWGPHFEYRDQQGKLHDGGRTASQEPVQITLGDDEFVDASYKVAASGTQKLFDTADLMGTFDFMFIVSSENAWLQVVVDDNASNGELYQVITLTQDVPHIFGSNAALAGNGSVDGFNGATDVIDRINFKNKSGSTAAHVRIFAGT